MQPRNKYKKAVFGPATGICITYAQKSPLNDHADVSRGVISLRLVPSILCVCEQQRPWPVCVFFLYCLTSTYCHMLTLAHLSICPVKVLTTHQFSAGTHGLHCLILRIKPVYSKTQLKWKIGFVESAPGSLNGSQCLFVS